MTPRFVVLKSLDDLTQVAATWPFGSIERVALAVYDQAENPERASEMAVEQFRDSTLVIMAIEDAEAEVRRLLKVRQGAALGRSRAFARRPA